MNQSIKKISLLKFMESYSKGHRLAGFKEFAQKHNQSYQSIRNDYYRILKQLSQEDFAKCELKHNRHIVKTHKPFSSEEMNDKINRVIDIYNKGMSLRASCLMIAGDDKILALRYQNKIRSMNLQKRGNNILKMVNFQFNKNTNAIYDTKLLYMSKLRTEITDKDINNLFLGLIRLVKRTYENQISNNLKERFNLINVELKEKNLELEEQKNRNLKLSNENISLKKQINQYREDLGKQSILYNKKLKNLGKMLQKFNNSLPNEVNKL